MIGQTISHYKILEKLGEGGMGVVYKAEDLKLKRTVAIKFLPKNLSVHGEERERFTLEAQAASALNHPNVATIYEIDEADGETFIVMEYVEGQTLREIKQGLTIKQVTDIGIQIAEGLAAAHDKGIVHRDVKAENIMLRKDHRVQVMDFGLAKLRGVSKLTKMGSTIGTIGYMSPEQVQGIETDHRTDIFSLGVVLYELLTAQLPFKGGHEAAVMYEIVNVEPTSISTIRQDVEPELERIIMKCLEKDRDERYHSVKDVAVDLKHFRRDSQGRHLDRTTPLPAPAPTFPGTAEPAGRRGGIPRRLVLMLAAFVIVVGAGLVVWRLLTPSTAINQNMVFKPLQLPFTNVGYPALSSDGNWIAFPATDENNVTELYYMHVSGGESRKLTNDSLWKFVADISPDGGEVVYTESGSRVPLSFPTAIFTISTLGGQRKKVAENGNAPRWSPDGRSIAYLAPGLRLQDGLWTMNADGSNKQMVLEDSLGQRVSLAWSPDGRSIAWLRTFNAADPYQEIIIKDLASGKERQLTHDKKNIDEVYWMPQGEILYSSNREGPSNLWAIPSDGGTPVQITRGPGPDLGIKASRDGTRVLYMQQATYGSIMIGDREGLNARQVTPDDLSVFDPQFSPSGAQVAFLVNDADPIKASTYIYLVDVDGKNRHQLTTGQKNIEDFVWSPDGRELAYTVHLGTEVDSAHRVEMFDISDPSQVSVIGHGRVIQWLKDGTALNIVSNGTSWRVPLQGGPPEKMFRDSTILRQSPDGAKYLVHDLRSGHNSFWLKEQNKPERLLYQVAIDAPGRIQWLPDNKHVVFQRNGAMQLLDVEKGTVAPYVWKNTSAVSFDAVSPDGKQTAFVRPRSNTKLILIDKFHK